MWIKRFIKSTLLIICISFFHSQIVAMHKISLKSNVLSSANWSSIYFESSNSDTKWKVQNIINEVKKRGWRSAENSPFPHKLIFELAGITIIDLLKFSNISVAPISLGYCAKEIQIEFSILGPTNGYKKIGLFTLENGISSQEIKIEKTKAKWIKLTILSNYGNEHFTELRSFEAWGNFHFDFFKIIANIIWILGAAIVIFCLSYIQFLKSITSIRITQILKNPNIHSISLIGLLMSLSGTLILLNRPFIRMLFYGIFFFLIIFLIPKKSIIRTI